MPAPRMSTPITRPGNASGSQVGLLQAVIMGVFGDNNKRYYVSVSGSMLTQAEATNDAAFEVGDVVWVQPGGSGWLITGTA